MLNRFAAEGERPRVVAAVAIALLAGLVVGAATMYMMRGDRPSTASAEPAAEHAELPTGVVEVTEAAQKNAGVELVAVKTARLPATLEVTGIVSADETRVAHVRPLARGVVEKIGVSLGSRVETGQSLLTYDNIELGQLVGEFLTAQAGLRQAQTEREVKRTVLSRAEALIKIEAISQQQLEQRTAEFRSSDAAVAAAEAKASQIEEQLHRFGLSDSDVAALRPDANETPHRAASHSILHAPFTGVITKLDAAAGEVVEPDKELFTVVDISSVWVLADVYERDIARVRRDGTVSIKVDAYPDRVFTGRVTHVSDIIDPATRAAKVRCVVENTDGALKLDMFAKVSLATLDERDTRVIPADAVQLVDNQPLVFVRQSATRFERRNTQLGRRAGDLVEVLGGVEDGQQIVSKGSFYLKTALLRDRIGDEH